MLTLANQTEKPIVLHTRREGEDYSAYEDAFYSLKHEWKQKSSTAYPGVLHCFCARYEEARKALDMGLLLGINGCFTYKKNEYIREAVKKAGADKIILETDCPYLSPPRQTRAAQRPLQYPADCTICRRLFGYPVGKISRNYHPQYKSLVWTGVICYILRTEDL